MNADGVKLKRLIIMVSEVTNTPLNYPNTRTLIYAIITNLYYYNENIVRRSNEEINLK